MTDETKLETAALNAADFLSQFLSLARDVANDWSAFREREIGATEDASSALGRIADALEDIAKATGGRDE